MTVPGSNELMQEGIKQVREGNTDQAYKTFKEVVKRNPTSEFGWIWISVTSNDRTEKRSALEKALEINPESQHAREALRNLDAEESRPAPVTPPPFGDFSNLPPPTFSPRIGEAETNTSPRYEPVEGDVLRAALSAKKVSKKAKPEVTKNQTMISRKPARRRSPLLIFLPVLLIAIFIFALLYVLVIQPRNQNNQPVATGPDQTTPTAISSPDTTGASQATSPAATSTTEAATATTAALATVTATTAATTPATTTTATSAAAGQTLPAGASQTAQIARDLRTAHDSQLAGDYKTAIISYQSALQADPRSVPANLGLGNAYLLAPDNALPGDAKRYEDAIRAFRVVTTQAPNWSGGYALLGEALADAGQIKPAIDAYSKSLELDPNGPERWLALAGLYDKDNQPDQARFARERSGSIKPPTPAPPTPTAVPPTAAPPPPAPPKTTVAVPPKATPKK